MHGGVTCHRGMLNCRKHAYAFPWRQWNTKIGYRLEVIRLPTLFALLQCFDNRKEGAERQGMSACELDRSDSRKSGTIGKSSSTPGATCERKAVIDKQLCRCGRACTLFTSRHRCSSPSPRPLPPPPLHCRSLPSLPQIRPLRRRRHRRLLLPHASLLLPMLCLLR